jgi:hypothetical protein
MNNVSQHDEQESVISNDTEDTRAQATRTALGEPAASGPFALYGRVAALAGLAMAVAVPLSLMVVYGTGEPTTVTFVI